MRSLRLSASLATRNLAQIRVLKEVIHAHGGRRRRRAAAGRADAGRAGEQ